MHLTNFHFYPYKNTLYSRPVKGLQGYGVGYGFAFNGKELDNETYGDGNAYDSGARIYDSRLGRWMSVDPLQLKFPFSTPYSFSLNKPINFKDYDGRDIIPSNHFKNSVYYHVTLNIVNSLNTMPLANKYIAPFLVAGNDIRLQFHSFSTREKQPLELEDSETKLAQANGAAKGKLGYEVITFNSDAAFKIQPRKDGSTMVDGETIAGVQVSEIAMASTVIHEFMHEGGVSHEGMAGETMRQEMKEALLKYAEQNKIKLSNSNAEILSWSGLQETKAFKSLPEAQQKALSSKIYNLTYNESGTTTDQMTEKANAQDTNEIAEKDKIKPN